MNLQDEYKYLVTRHDRLKKKYQKLRNALKEINEFLTNIEDNYSTSEMSVDDTIREFSYYKDVALEALNIQK